MPLLPPPSVDLAPFAFSRRRKRRLGWFTIAVAGFAGFARSAESHRPSVEALWAGVNVRSAPLDLQIQQEWRGEGIVTRKLTYASHIQDGYQVRIIAFYAFPVGKQKEKLPAILHLHGGGQTASRSYVELLARHGYAALSVNWGGNPLENGQGNSDWGPFAVDQADNAKVFRVRPEPRDNPWFWWAIACRRGLTVLEQQPEVDATRLGLFGISMGGRLAWMVAGIDERVTTAVSIYGAVKMADPLPGIPGSEQITFQPEDAAIWRAALDASAYAPRVHCPFFFLSAANDFYGSMDAVDSVLATIPGRERRQSFTPHFNHHVEPAQSASFLPWMDRWLMGGPKWPESPRLEHRAVSSDGVPSLEVLTDRPGEIATVQVFYSTDPYPASRFWRTAATMHEDGRWRAQLPMTELSGGLYAFANVGYRSGLSLSSLVLKETAAELESSRVKATDRWSPLIDGFERGAADWFVPDTGVNPLLQDRIWFEAVAGPDGTSAVRCKEFIGRIWRMATRKVGDAKWNGGREHALNLQLWADQPNTMVVVATEDERRRPAAPKTYLAEVRLSGGKWEAVILPPGIFHEVDTNAPLASWERVNLLGFQSQYVRRAAKGKAAKNVGAPWQGAPAAIAALRWVPAP
jgi:dienelactone hydrolase